MNHFNPSNSGFVLGLALSGFHAVWSLIVALGLGQALMDFILWAHMVHVPYTVGPFDAEACVTLLIFTFVVGYAIGFLFALIWNKVHKS